MIYVIQKGFLMILELNMEIYHVRNSLLQHCSFWVNVRQIWGIFGESLLVCKLANLATLFLRY